MCAVLAQSPHQWTEAVCNIRAGGGSSKEHESIWTWHLLKSPIRHIFFYGPFGKAQFSSQGQFYPDFG